MRHYSAVASDIIRTQKNEPIYAVDPHSGETFWQPWINGFTCAMSLRMESWQGLLHRADGEARSALIFLMALQDIADGNIEFPEADAASIDLQAPDMIPNCIASILRVSRPNLDRMAGNLSRAPI